MNYKNTLERSKCAVLPHVYVALLSPNLAPLKKMSIHYLSVFCPEPEDATILKSVVYIIVMFWHTEIMSMENV